MNRKIKIQTVNLIISFTIIFSFFSISTAEVNVQELSDVEIRITGLRGIRILINDLRENQSENITTQIWINYSYFIRPIFLSQNDSLFHRYIFRISTSATQFIWSRNPYRISLGHCLIEIKVGNIYDKKEFLILGQFSFIIN